MYVHHVNHAQQLQLIALCIYRCSRCGFTVGSMCECVTKSTALNCMLGICLPIPRVCTSLALLCAPSPLVVYAATETEYRVSAFRPPKISSCATRNKQINKQKTWNRTFKWHNGQFVLKTRQWSFFTAASLYVGSTPAFLMRLFKILLHECMLAPSALKGPEPSLIQSITPGCLRFRANMAALKKKASFP